MMEYTQRFWCNSYFDVSGVLPIISITAFEFGKIDSRTGSLQFSVYRRRDGIPAFFAMQPYA